MTGSNLTPTQIVDKNGKTTTVHKKEQRASASSRVREVGRPPKIDSVEELLKDVPEGHIAFLDEMQSTAAQLSSWIYRQPRDRDKFGDVSNLERFLRNEHGINIILRKQLIRAYESNNGAVEVPRLIEENERLINDSILPTLRALAKDEDFEYESKRTEYESSIVRDYSEKAVEFSDDLARKIRSLETFRDDESRGLAHAKLDVLNEVAADWVRANESTDTTKGFGAFHDALEAKKFLEPVPERKAGYQLAIDSIKRYVMRSPFVTEPDTD